MKNKTGKDVFCETCSAMFYVPKYRIQTTKFCSRKCKDASICKKFKGICKICGEEFDFIAFRADKAKYCSRTCYYKAMHLKGTVEITCFYCKKTFKTSPSHHSKFCSRMCVGLSKRLTFTGEYTTVRKAMILRGLLKQCETCGFKDDIRVLGIHHKDKNRNNNSPENLIVLCPTCHSLIHKKHIIH